MRICAAVLLAICIGWFAPLPASAQVTATADPVGDALAIAVPLAAAGLTLYHQDLDGFKQWGLSTLLAQGTTEVAKRVVNSPRPDGTGYGFPSGHTSIVFAAAGFVHRRYGLDEAWPFYVLGTVTAYERVRHHHHSTTDVVGGAVIGVGSAFLLTKPLPDGAVVGVAWRAGGPWVSYARSW